VRTDNLDLVLSQITAEECNDAADELARYLDAGLMTTRELLAAFLNDLNNECLTRWVPAARAVTPVASQYHHPETTTPQPRPGGVTAIPMAFQPSPLIGEGPGPGAA
jgi:hypothetical protein